MIARVTVEKAATASITVDDNNDVVVAVTGIYVAGNIPATYLQSGDNVSELTNDAGYLNAIPATYLESGDNISELVNDAGYLTAVPSNYFNKNTDDSDNINEGSTNLFYTTARKNTAVAEYFTIACSDEASDIEAATGVVEFQMPFGMTLSGVRATVTTAPVGSTIQVDINKNSSSILSTVISIDAGEKTSETAATTPVISDTSLSDGDVITIDIDQIGSSTAGTGLKVQLIGIRT
jgi:hypothetical protein